MHVDSNSFLKNHVFLAFNFWWQRFALQAKSSPIFFYGLGLLIITRLVAMYLFFDLGPYADEDNYVSRGVAFLDMISPQNGKSSSDYLDAFYYNGYWPPLYSIILGPIYKLFGYGGVRIFLILADIVTGILFYLVAKRLLTNTASLIALYLYALNPFLWVASFSILSEGLFNLSICAILLTYLNLQGGTFFKRSKIGLYVLSLGLLMASALLIRSAFVLVFILLAIVSVVRFWKQREKLAIFAMASLLMFALTIPWNLLIKHQEHKFMFMHTISEQQFYMKFVNRGGGWNSVREQLLAEASAEHKSIQIIAKEKTHAYFEENTNPLLPVSVMLNDFRNDYLMGESEHERRLRLGLYDTSSGKDKLHWCVLIWHELYRFPILFFGALGLLCSVGRFNDKDIFIAAAIGTASVGIFGLTWGRHLVNLMPFLILGSAVSLEQLRRSSKGYLVFSIFSLIGFSVLGFNIWQVKNSGYWAATNQSKLLLIGKPYSIVDQLQLRKLDGCTDIIKLDPTDKNWTLSYRSLGKSDNGFKEIIDGGDIVPEDYILLDIKPKNQNITAKTIKYVINDKTGEIPLDKGRNTTDWSPLPNTCIRINH